MSLLTEAQVTILLADYANADAGGKLNVVGGTVRFLGQQAEGQSTPFSLVVMVDVPFRYVGTDFALTVEVYDATLGRPVAIPGPGGEPQALRAQQVVTVQPLPPMPGLRRPDNPYMSTNMIMNFGNGLPLPMGHAFEARVQIDGQTRHWFYRFHTLAPEQGPVFGGPMNPPHIPGVGEYVVSTDDGDPSATDDPTPT